MGNIYSSSASLVTSGLPSFLAELAGFDYEKSLGTGKFLKTIRCRSPQDGTVIVKIFVKPQDTATPMSLHKHLSHLQSAS